MISYALIEQAELSQSSKQRASRGILSSYKNVHTGSFDGKAEFRLQLQAAMRQLLCEPGEIQKVLIVSAHGEPLTGTLLASRSGPAEEEELIDLWEYNDHFKVAPPNLTVFLSSCWGAYFEVARAIQQNAQPCPVVVGPLVNVQFPHAQEMQACLLRALGGIQLKRTAPPNRYGELASMRNALAPVFKKFNGRQYRSAYHQRYVLGIHFSEGDFHPGRAVGMPAAPPVDVRGILHELRAHGRDGVRPVYGDTEGRTLVGLTRHQEEFAGRMGMVNAEYALSIQIVGQNQQTGEYSVHILRTRPRGRKKEAPAPSDHS